MGGAAPVGVALVAVVAAALPKPKMAPREVGGEEGPAVAVAVAGGAPCVEAVPDPQLPGAVAVGEEGEEEAAGGGGLGVTLPMFRVSKLTAPRDAAGRKCMH